MSFVNRAFRAAIAIFLAASSVRACSVLSHEAIIDALWDVKIKPLLLKRYPAATAEQIKTAHAFAYGGSIVQDLGYYPHGSKEFSDLAHYVRTGDFIRALIGEAQDVNELAFAYGALSHYISDVDVHSRATNFAVPILYPRDLKKFGKVVTYEQDPGAHLKTEFGFDVLEVARGNFAPQAYHDFIGFSIAPGVLDRALQDTFDIRLNELFDDFDRSIGSYRRDISQLIPKATRIAWAQRKDEIRRAQPGMTYRRFVYIMKRSSYERSWGKQYDVPSRGERILAVLLKLIPPIGPLRNLKLRMPTPAVEKLFVASFARAVDQSKAHLDEAQADHKTLEQMDLDDLNYDVGVHTNPGQYRLEDRSYANWLHLLAKKNYAGVTPEIKAKILAYYRDPNAPIDTQNDPEKWAQVQAELPQLKAAPAEQRSPRDNSASQSQ